jgi:FMN phosphatase YigB (HAD superfamily)
VHSDVVAGCVRRWMEEEPLSLLSRCVYPGTLDMLKACRAKGLRLAALSDYPADEKLRAMGMAGLFDVVLCAQAPDVNAFKPNPRGLLVALDRLGVGADECLYVGDRADVDAPAAAAAGIRCAILRHRHSTGTGDSFVPVSDVSALLALIDSPASTVNHTRGRL